MPITRDPAAEIPYPAGDNTRADYHRITETEVFMECLERRPLPAFRKGYGEKMILTFVNPHHHQGMEGYIRRPPLNDQGQ